MKEYVKIVWDHDNEDKPTVIYLELDINRFNTRKIELYRKDKFGFADKNQSFNNTYLFKDAFPSLEVYNTMDSKLQINWAEGPQAYSIPIREFNMVWNLFMFKKNE